MAVHVDELIKKLVALGVVFHGRSVGRVIKYAACRARFIDEADRVSLEGLSKGNRPQGKRLWRSSDRDV